MSPWARRPGWACMLARVDVALAPVLCAAGVAEVVVAGRNAAVAVAAVLWSLPLALRRRAPVAPALAVLAAVVLNQALGDLREFFLVGIVCSLVASYSVAAHGSWRQAVLGGLALLLSLELYAWWAGYGTADSTLWMLLVLALTWLSGRLVLGYRERGRQLLALAARLEREASVLLVVAEERARIARELHDAIADAVAGMIVQAAAAERLVTVDAARCRRAVTSVQDSGRDGIAELRACCASCVLPRRVARCPPTMRRCRRRRRGECRRPGCRASICSWPWCVSSWPRSWSSRRSVMTSMTGY